jgi:hypothetical protein
LNRPIRAGQLGDLRRSTLPFGDDSEILAVASTAKKKLRCEARHQEHKGETHGQGTAFRKA